MHGKGQIPFTLRVGQLMTGFGVGCGVGLGVGYPIPLGSLPVVGDLMSATGTASSRAFGGIGRHAYGVLLKLGIKNLKAGIGCGIGVGHGFGVGVTLKPGATSQIILCVQKCIGAVAMQFQNTTEVEDLPGTSNTLAHPVFSSDNKVHDGPQQIQHEVAHRTPLVGVTRVQPVKTGRIHDEVENLRHENEIMHMLLRHQGLIEDLKKENEALRQILDQICEEYSPVEMKSNSLAESEQSMFRSSITKSINSCRRSCRRRHW